MLIWLLIGHKQNRELNDDVLLTRQRAVMSLCDYLHDPEHISAAIDEGKLIMAGFVIRNIYRGGCFRCFSHTHEL